MKRCTLSFPICLMVTLVVTTTCLAQEAGVRGRRVGTPPAAEATVAISDQFLNSFLDAMFDNLHEPAMPLNLPGGPQPRTNGSSNGPSGCASEIKLRREMAGVRTSVHFENGHITGPLAFSGSFGSSLLGCLEFSGWAGAEMELSFDSARQALVARFHMREIHLNDVPAIANGPLVSMVQTAIDQKYNPVELITLEQVSTKVNIQPAGGALRLRATEIRPEITPSSLTLRIYYEFVRG